MLMCYVSKHALNDYRNALIIVCVVAFYLNIHASESQCLYRFLFFAIIAYEFILVASHCVGHRLTCINL